MRDGGAGHASSAQSIGHASTSPVWKLLAPRGASSEQVERVHGIVMSSLEHLVAYEERLVIALSSDEGEDE